VSITLTLFGQNKCECGCGERVPLDKRGKTQHYRRGHNAVGPDLVGRIFEFATVLTKAEKRGGSNVWWCRCKCGKEYKTKASALLCGRNRGCRTCTNGNLGRPFEGLFRQLLLQCKHHPKLVSLTYEEYLEFTKVKTCHYCKTPIVWNPHGNQKSGYKLDRKDNSVGYTKANCVVCCARCNRGKGADFTYAEWREIGKVIASW
jgi:hypothetical protein